MYELFSVLQPKLDGLFDRHAQGTLLAAIFHGDLGPELALETVWENDHGFTHATN